MKSDKIESPINLNLELSAKAEIKLDVTETFDAATLPGAKVVGSLFAAIIYDRYGQFITKTLRKKIEDEYETKKIELIKEVEHNTLIEIMKINESNRTHPKYSLVVPAIEALDVYYDEEHYRQMFSKLIASTMNISKYNDLHPSFSQIIKSISPSDAKILSIIENSLSTSSIKICRLIAKGENQCKSQHILIDLTIDEISEEEITFSINNLESLGLIDASLTSFNDDIVDDIIPNYALNSQTYKELIKVSKEVYSISGDLVFTIRGRKFANIIFK